MTEMVVALLMIVHGEIKEARIQESMSECLKGKRLASRTASSQTEFKCIKTRAELETNIDGSTSIKKIVLGL